MCGVLLYKGCLLYIYCCDVTCLREMVCQSLSDRQTKQRQNEDKRFYVSICGTRYLTVFHVHHKYEKQICWPALQILELHGRQLQMREIYTCTVCSEFCFSLANQNGLTCTLIVWHKKPHYHVYLKTSKHCLVLCILKNLLQTTENLSDDVKTSTWCVFNLISLEIINFLPALWSLPTWQL